MESQSNTAAFTAEQGPYEQVRGDTGWGQTVAAANMALITCAVTTSNNFSDDQTL